MFSFVVLHYMNYKNTVRCVDSITDIDYEDYAIVIVDNNSTNDSWEKIKDRYSSNKKIHFVGLEENLGVPKGYNAGFAYSKQRFNPDFILLLNNDIVFLQKDVVKRMIDTYQNEYFDILGPSVISLDGEHQSPFNSKLPPTTIKGKLIHFTRRTIAFILRVIQLEDVVVEYHRKKFANRDVNYDQLQTDVVVHGCCLILSKNYIQNYKGLYDNTFIMKEEIILYYIAKQEGLKIVYNPDIVVRHDLDDTKQERGFKRKEGQKSFKELKRMMKDNTLYKKNMKEVMK